jgi:hypothetical protein
MIKRDGIKPGKMIDVGATPQLRTRKNGCRAKLIFRPPQMLRPRSRPFPASLLLSRQAPRLFHHDNALVPVGFLADDGIASGR